MRYWSRVEVASRRELRRIQLKRLKRAVRYVWSRSRFYRRKLREAGFHPSDLRSLEDIRRVPLTGKEELRELQLRNVREGRPPYDGLLCVPEREVATCVATTGTTGVPLIVPLTLRDASMYHGGEVCHRGYVAVGLKPGDIVQNAFNHSFWFVSASLVDLACRTPEYPTVYLASHIGNSRLQLKLIQELRPKAFSSTPSYCLYLAELAREQGVDPRELGVEVLLLAGEPGASIPSFRARLEEAWGARAYDIYGLVEMGWVGGECWAQSGIHVAEDVFLAEVVDPEAGEPVGEGEEGSLVLTHLRREAMPLLRYDTRDIVKAAFEPCECGRTHMRLVGGIVGRATEQLKVKGLAVYPSQVAEALNRIPECTGHFLIVVGKDAREILDTCTIRVEVRHGSLSDELRRRIARELQSTIWITPEVELVEEGELSRFVMKSIRVLDLRKPGALKAYLQSSRAQQALA